MLLGIALMEQERPSWLGGPHAAPGRNGLPFPSIQTKISVRTRSGRMTAGKVGPMPTEASRLQAIREKVEAGQRLSFDDGVALDESNDLFALGEMANLVRERYNGNFGYYNVNTHINPTNVCVYTCDFCAFRADLDDSRAYVMDHDQIVERARQAHERGATELHIVGGLHHKLPFDYYVDVVRWIHDAYPEIHIKAYTAVEIEFFSKIARISNKEVIERLIDAGLGSLPGGGAEIFHPEVREQICGAKAS